MVTKDSKRRICGSSNQSPRAPICYQCCFEKVNASLGRNLALHSSYECAGFDKQAFLQENGFLFRFLARDFIEY